MGARKAARVRPRRRRANVEAAPRCGRCSRAPAVGGGRARLGGRRPEGRNRGRALPDGAPEAPRQRALKLRHRAAYGDPMLSIDVHHHILPDFFWRETETNEQSPVGGIAPPPWSKESALAFLDEAGIDVAVTSISSPGVHMGDDARARVLARRCNELSAE